MVFVWFVFEVLLVLWFVFCVSGTVAKVLKMLVLSCFGFFVGWFILVYLDLEGLGVFGGSCSCFLFRSCFCLFLFLLLDCRWCCFVLFFPFLFFCSCFFFWRV